MAAPISQLTSWRCRSSPRRQPCADQVAVGTHMNTYLGKDNIMRVVDVKTSRGVYKRPVTKIALLLPVENWTLIDLFTYLCLSLLIFIIVLNCNRYLLFLVFEDHPVFAGSMFIRCCVTYLHTVHLLYHAYVPIHIVHASCISNFSVR